jgi:hypothetical protein
MTKLPNGPEPKRITALPKAESLRLPAWLVKSPCDWIYEWSVNADLKQKEAEKTYREKTKRKQAARNRAWKQKQKESNLEIWRAKLREQKRKERARKKNE